MSTSNTGFLLVFTLEKKVKLVFFLRSYVLFLFEFFSHSVLISLSADFVNSVQ